ncbi:hypothetical protein EWM64_g1483 [Hericium alpestre]|uniref:Structural maintenance of chromosomes protein 5 n=1 Tax=Hericium alpestre TaxID=135208 RepID=A0A4Z0A8D3_9AGAM|nr:hypothetical protein EWM64_g1483 [Hericium alpestre]
MARRIQRVDNDNDSQKENSAIPKDVRVKAEKNGAAPRPSQDASQADPEDVDAEGEEGDGDGDAEGEDEEQDEDGDAAQESPKGRKRARVNEDGDARPAKKEKGTAKARQAHERDVDGYVTGSIVRVKLENFVTYDHVEFRPGPHMNMIIGPNGTGKSSIACAIALGLNYPPSILGRAAELNSFVKMGTSEGFIEIELKGKIGKPNLVIRRNLSSKSKSSTFTINDQSASGKEVAQKMNELNIQVGNLCSFLPQDKVSEFAQMTPQQLLRETQRAAGDEHLTAWHDTLINAGKEMKELTELLNADTQQLKTLEERNAILERDVARYNERKEIERQIGLLELILPFMEYIEARNRYMDAKKLQRDLHQRVQALKKKNAPAHALKKRLEAQHKELNEAREKKKKDTQRKFRAMQSKWDDNEKLAEEAEELDTKLSNIKKEEKARAKKIIDTEKRIADMKRDRERTVKLEDPDDLQLEHRNVEASGQGLRDRQTDLQFRQRKNVEDMSNAQSRIDAGERSLKELDDVSKIKMENFKRFDRDSADVVEWIRRNPDRFTMKVLEPPFMTIKVANKQFVDAVESCFSFNQLRTFVTQCEADYKMINRLFVDTDEALGRRARISAWYRPGDANAIVPPPMSREELHACGFDGYAMDYVEYPEEMKYYLMRDVGLHRTAVGLRQNQVNVQRATDLCSRSGSGSFISGMVNYFVKRSRYGKQLPQTNTNDIRRAQHFVGQTADAGVREEHKRKINEARQQHQLHQEEMAKLTEEDNAIRAEYAEYKKKLDGIKARRQKVVDEKKRLQRLQSAIEVQETKLQDLLNAPSADAERNKLKKKIVEVTQKRTLLARQYADLVRAAIDEQQEATRIGLKFIQVGSNKAALEIHLQARDVAFNKAMAEFETANKVYVAAKDESAEKLKIGKDKLDSVEPDLRTQFQKMEEDGSAHTRDADEIRNELATQNQRLELVLQTNPGVVEQYERRKAEIETLSKKIAEREKKAGKVGNSIKLARENWEPALNELVQSIGERFSNAFDRIGCAGEIRISPNEDYDKWAIDILVKFRDNEKLQLLTGQRQSGGERSLTTILYLMSMTEHAHAPFSLVDEINQGMDVRAERTVHNELVKTTCKEDSGQYFLITPKLLPDLLYHPRMKVLCVNNGEWLPDEKGIGNMKSMINTYLQRKAQGKAAA